MHGRIRFAHNTFPDSFSLVIRGEHGQASTDLFHPFLDVRRARSVGPQLSPIADHVANGFGLVRSGATNFGQKLLQHSPYHGLDRFLGLTYEALATGATPPVTPRDILAAADLVDRLCEQREETGLMRLFITGATGFVGRHVVAEAVARGHHVTALVRTGTDPAMLDAALATGRVDLVRGDLSRSAPLVEPLRGTDVLLHLAAVKGGDYFARFAGTVIGTENLLAAAGRGRRREPGRGQHVLGLRLLGRDPATPTSTRRRRSSPTSTTPTTTPRPSSTRTSSTGASPRERDGTWSCSDRAWSTAPVSSGTPCSVANSVR